MLIKQSPDKAGSKNESRPQGTDKPRRPQGAAKGPRPQTGDNAKRAQGGDKGQRAPRPEKRESPVDPVVVAISRLQRHFPKAFPKNPAPKVPLKLGVLADLVQHAEQLQLDEAQIKEAVKTWCDGRRYWASMVEDAPRVDLNGEPAGAVTANEARHAKRMASRNASRNAARARAEKKAQASAEQTPAPADDAAPADVKPADVQSADATSADTKAVDTKAVDTKAAGATPADVASSDVTPQASE
ncbi:ProQ/FinO family protein [Achromobacter mucicolens]|nr:ProQ/FinO family protein [Achromobacter mucicolens]